MDNVYILGGLRTPIVLKNGVLRCCPPEDFCARLLQSLRERYALADIDAVICGNAVGTGGNITRLMTLKAGLAETVPAYTVDMQCASAALSIELAQAKIASGQADLVIAGGFESSSLQPLRVYAEQDSRYGEVSQGRYTVAQFSPGENDPQAMLWGAERVARAEKISRRELDFWTLESHRRAAAAREAGVLNDIIMPVAGAAADEGIRARMSQKLLDRLPPLLGKDTQLTAGSACLINDGAALVALCSERYLAQHGLRPQARLLAAQSLGGNPLESPRGAMATADALLSRCGYSYEDLAAIEFNEAFAVIDVLFARLWPQKTAQYNTFGGALAYGHPYGASGAILLLHLLKALQQKGGGLGLCSIAGAGGMGCALLLEGME